jgi:hypothetical protein
MPKSKYGASFWGLQIPGWLLLIYLVYAQGITAFGYDIGVAMGTQEFTSDNQGKDCHEKMDTGNWHDRFIYRHTRQ